MRSRLLKGVKERAMQANRQHKLDHFYTLCSGGRVLDVGVSGKTTMRAGNMFVNTYRLGDESYTGLGIEDLTEISRQHPGKRFVEYDGRGFPFGDGEFDWVFSNAVVEHVGLDEDQLFFVNEMLRVGRSVFFTTPNKYFPIEAHTNLPLLHWNNRLFYRWCEKNRPWTNRGNLYLFSYRRLHSMMASSSAIEYEIYISRLLGWPMTFTVVCSGRK